MVVWIIGKSGVGKTYFAKHLAQICKEKHKRLLWVDGDKFRKKYSRDLGYSLNDRRKNSLRIQKHCKKYEDKKYLVICSLISLFKSHQRKNRKIFTNYLQIFIKANSKLIERKNNKNIYSNKKNVVGRDILFPIPYKSDIVIKNNFNTLFKKNLKKIYTKLNEKL
ncbi:adenylyl-sulfate kinase [Candidatus Pelagibacter sp. Uisw_130]|uniref:adenylyl-sulfate kinase n=1 Tax=Candidatus Pelagibacter sp. Uisw_130 TaxID=3230989 RepID=UPI0039E91B07